MELPLLGPAYAAEDTFRRSPLRDLVPEESGLAACIKHDAAGLEKLLLSLPPSRERSAAITKLEEAVFWAVKGATA